MNQHYHVVVLSGGAVLMQSIYADYFESIMKWHGLVQDVWHEVPNVSEISVRRMVEETENGEGSPVAIGTGLYCFLWHRCSECDPSYLN